MGKSSCCDKKGLKKGSWTPEEDQKLLAYIEGHGHGSWRALPAKAGLQRCGKSCRLRWINYLRPDIKRGKFTLQEEQTIIQLHALLGNRWSVIATHLPKRTDNEIKNHWNTHLKKRLNKMGIDPVTHKPKIIATSYTDGSSAKNVANLSHMAQWESARLEAEARLVRECKLLAPSSNLPLQFHRPVLPWITSKTTHSSTRQHLITNKAVMVPREGKPQCLDVLKAWEGEVSNMFFTVTSATRDVNLIEGLKSPTSTLSFSENVLPITTTVEFSENQVDSNFLMCRTTEFKDDGQNDNSYKCQHAKMSNQKSPEFWKYKLDNDIHAMVVHEMTTYPNDRTLFYEDSSMVDLSGRLAYHGSSSNQVQDPPLLSFNNGGSYVSDMVDEEISKSYWENMLLNVANYASPSGSPVF